MTATLPARRAPDPGIVLNLFSGPGGWCTGALLLTLARVVGIELDKAACATRAAAGHATIRADVAQYPVAQLAALVRALVGSPPCTVFSQAGDRAGDDLFDILATLILDLAAGRDTRQQRMAEMAAVLNAAGWALSRMKNPDQAAADAKTVKAVASAALVAEPARYIHATRPEWLALEQVREALPLWQVYAAVLRRQGYSAWCGVLNAADYGVPQTRQRAILVASRVRDVTCPAPTHHDPRKGIPMFGDTAEWVTMCQALGFGATAVPAPTVTGGGTATGGAEPFGNRSRQMLARELSEGRWVLRMDRQRKAVTRGLHEPAQTIKAGHSAASEAAWVRTDVDFRREIPCEPGELAALQSFPDGYPFQGTRGQRFRQIGDAVPPGLARRVLAEAAGVSGRLADLAA